MSFEYTGPTSATDHNGYVRGDNYYLANYTAGMRVIDISDIANGNMSETGYFDVYPSNDNSGYNGAWNVYPYFGSGNIIISTLYSGGFFLVKSSTADTTDPVAVCQNISVSLDADGNVVVDPSDVDGGSSDNSGFFSLELNINTFDCDDIGANPVILTVTDPSGNSATCIAVITIEDDLAPEVSCPADSTVGPDIGELYYTLPDYVADGDTTATDNCTTSFTISQDPIAGTQLTDGTHTISFETMDDEGNIGTCSFELIMDETLAIGDNSLASGLSLYPNPTSTFINIRSNNERITSIEVRDILGKRLHTDLTIDADHTSIDISGINSGMYFLTINNSVTKKIIKQ